ncbi:hypothetical protein C6502_01245 [Candidatus Poribacteria bacterium]|nr:MAG: hypothetical protein C6502_01245 [Candidatus Poribacteria bacterium]
MGKFNLEKFDFCKLKNFDDLRSKPSGRPVSSLAVFHEQFGFFGNFCEAVLRSHQYGIETRSVAQTVSLRALLITPVWNRNEL